MKITDRFIGDHKTFRKMMADIDAIAGSPEASRDRARLIRLTDLLKDHLIVHSWFEDQFYYPALREVFMNSRMPPFADAYVQRMEEEHRGIDGHLDRLEREIKGEPMAASWPQTFVVLFHVLNSHMRKEEEELFPASEKLLGAEGLEKLSLEIERHRFSAPKARLHSRA